LLIHGVVVIEDEKLFCFALIAMFLEKGAADNRSTPLS